MQQKRNHKRYLAGLLALLLSVSMCAAAEEAEVTDTPQPETTTISEPVTQLPKEAEQPEDALQAAEVSETPGEITETSVPALQTAETTPEAPTERPADEGPSTPSPTATAEAPAEAPTERPAGEEPPTPSPTIEATVQAPPSVTIKWVIEAEDGFLRLGDEITLKAKITPELEGVQLQWQVATKPSEDLKDNEPEWADIPGAQGSTYTFVLADGMQGRRWRLFITLSEGEPVYSDEIKLPAISLETETTEDVPRAVEDEAMLGFVDGQATPDTVNDEVTTNAVADEAAQQEPKPLPIANITYTAKVPTEEITYGTEVTLVAEILNPCEGMLLQWQYMPAKAELTEEWQAVADATESSYTYVVDEVNAGRLWRLLITAPAEETENAVSNQDIAALSDTMEPTPTPDSRAEGGDSDTH